MKIVVDYAHNHVEICRLDFTRKLLFYAFYFAHYTNNNTTVVVRVVVILCLQYLAVVRKKHLCQAHSIYLVQRSYSCYNRLCRLHVENIDFNFTGCATIHSLANTLHKLIVQSNNEANLNCVWCIKVRCTSASVLLITNKTNFVYVERINFIRNSATIFFLCKLIGNATSQHEPNTNFIRPR